MTSSTVSSVSGMAFMIRSADESETFDFAGASEMTIQQTIADAFSEPFPLSKMIRLTFITGAGKLERQKYNENCSRIIMTILRENGYEEDRGASAVMECAGTYKSQHDTGKNLKTVVVFPKICSPSSSTTTTTTTANQLSNQKEKETSDINSGEEKIDAKTSIIHSSFPTFQKLIEHKCISWSQKKACLQLITDLEDQLRTFDTKLIHGQALTSTQQEIYNSTSMDNLEEKSKYLKGELAKHVEEGNITQTEKDKLIRQTQERIDLLSQEITSKEGSKKGIDSLLSQKEKATARLSTIKQIVVKPPVPLKYAVDIERLGKELKPLLQLEMETKGRLLTIKEATMLARKGEILQEIQKFEETSRGWFEDDTDFQIRVEASRKSTSLKNSTRTAAVKNTLNNNTTSRSTASRQTSTATAVSSSKGSTTAWSTANTSATTKTNSTQSTTNVSKKSSSTTKANTFAAMMMDSDSDTD